MRGTYITMALTVAGTLVVITRVAGTEDPPSLVKPLPADVRASHSAPANGFAPLGHEPSHCPNQIEEEGFVLLPELPNLGDHRGGLPSLPREADDQVHGA